MIDTAEFIAKNYYNDETLERVEKVRKFLAYPGIYVEGSPDDGLVLVYLTLSEEGLELLKSAKTEDDFKNGFSERLLQYPGNHIYVCRLVAQGVPRIKALRTLRNRIIQKHHAASFSWHDNARVVLHTHEVVNV